MEIKDFLLQIQQTLEAVRKKRSQEPLQDTSNFDPVSLFSPNENCISNILAFFLDPWQSHGLGDVFLRDFLEFHFPECSNDYQNGKKNCHVSCQFRTQEGRPIDIVVQVGTFYLGFENKIWNAQDQYEQVKDYMEDLEARSQGKYRLFYLSPHGESPSPQSLGTLTQSAQEKHLTVISFSSAEEDGVIPMLKRWRKLAEKVPVVQLFLSKIILFLSKHFGEKFIMDDEINAVIDIVEKNFDSIPVIYQAYRNIQKNFLKAICEDFGEKFHPEKFNGKDQFLSGRKNLQIEIERSNFRTIFEIDPKCVRIGILNPLNENQRNEIWQDAPYQLNEFWQGGYRVITEKEFDSYCSNYLHSAEKSIKTTFDVELEQHNDLLTRIASVAAKNNH